MTSKIKIQFCDLESDLHVLSETIDNSNEIHSKDQKTYIDAIDTAVKVSRSSMHILTDIEKCIELLSQDGIGSKTTVKEILEASLNRIIEVLK